MTHSPLIVDIKRYSCEDGPGIRSVVFFKGCPLRCMFCHNPETQRPWMEIAYSEIQCIQCGACSLVCPKGAIDYGYSGRILREKCDRCGKCADACPGNGLRRVGKYLTVESLTEILLKDSSYYHSSGGGVTLSGGECTMFPQYLERLLKSLKASEIHVVLETSGYFDYDTFRRKLLPYLDLVYYDLKLVDLRAHKKFTAASNALILENFRRLIRLGCVEVMARVPLVPGITATEENLTGLARYVRGAGAGRIMLLPYNPMGIHKYPSLGMPSPDLPEKFMKSHEEEKAREMPANAFT
ncbi:MAG: glycyl-radical enzyme activating protein [Pseudomonadota bacterium]